MTEPNRTPAEERTAQKIAERDRVRRWRQRGGDPLRQQENANRAGRRAAKKALR
jgi:hypothetical protein